MATQWVYQIFGCSALARDPVECVHVGLEIGFVLGGLGLAVEARGFVGDE